MSDFVLDASLALQWFLEDEENRKYSLAVLASLSEKRRSGFPERLEATLSIRFSRIPERANQYVHTGRSA